MAYLDVNLSVPIALLVASIVGVIMVRLAITHGEKRARERTHRLIERHGMPKGDGASTNRSSVADPVSTARS